MSILNFAGEVDWMNVRDQGLLARTVLFSCRFSVLMGLCTDKQTDCQNSCVFDPLFDVVVYLFTTAGRSAVHAELAKHR